MSKIIDFPIAERQKRQISDLEQRLFMVETTINQLLLFLHKKGIKYEKNKKIMFIDEDKLVSAYVKFLKEKKQTKK